MNLSKRPDGNVKDGKLKDGEMGNGAAGVDRVMNPRAIHRAIEPPGLPLRHRPLRSRHLRRGRGIEAQAEVGRRSTNMQVSITADLVTPAAVGGPIDMLILWTIWLKTLQTRGSDLKVRPDTRADTQILVLTMPIRVPPTHRGLVSIRGNTPLVGLQVAILAAPLTSTLPGTPFLALFVAPLVSTPLANSPQVSSPLAVAPLVTTPLVSFPLAVAPLVSTPLISTRLVSTPLANVLLANIPPGRTADNIRVSTHLGSTPTSRAGTQTRQGLVSFTMSIPAPKIPMVSLLMNRPRGLVGPSMSILAPRSPMNRKCLATYLFTLSDSAL